MLIRLLARPAILTLALASLLACKEASVPRSVSISEAAANHTTELAVGDRLVLTLAENITTGYSWTLDDAGCTAALHLDSDQPSHAAAGSPPGAPGQRTWTFTARNETQCELRLVSARPWEKTATGSSLVFPVAIRKGS